MSQSHSLSIPFDFPQASPYTAERSFSAAKYEETIWNRLLANDIEGYRLHLAFEISKVEGFKTGYIAVKRNGIVVCLAPYFITDYRLDTTVQGSLKHLLTKVQKYAPRLLSIRLICLGSPVTDSCKIGFSKDYPIDAEMINTITDELEHIAAREKASVIAFKDVLECDAQRLKPALKRAGYGQVANMPVATNLIQFKNMDEYLASLSYATRKNLRRKLKSRQHVTIEEHNGRPPNIEAVYQLYLQTFERSDLKFEKLTQDFFESVAGLMPENCKFVLYYAENQLIAFNLLLHRDGVLLDKYIGMQETLAKKYNIYFLSWLHNIEMCIRYGFHTYQSGQAAYETKIRLGATLEDTHIFFRHRNNLLNKPLSLLANIIAYGNFDRSVSKQSS